MPKIRPSLKLDFSALQKPLEQPQKKNTSSWMQDNMKIILDSKKGLPDKKVSPNYQFPSYPRAQDAGFGFDISGWNVSNTTEDVFIHFLKADKSLKGEYDGDKFHLSVASDQIGDAYSAIAPILCAKDSPFEKWKITDEKKCSSGARVFDGAQITLYAKPDKEDSTYSANYLKSVESTLGEIEMALKSQNISSGLKPESDISKESWNYLSYRNEYRSDRIGSSQQQQHLQREPFFQCIE